MKHFKALVLASLFLVPLAGHLAAQIDRPSVFTTTFPFTAGNATFPAGTYELRPFEGDGGIVQILSTASSGVPSAYIEVQAAQRPPAKPGIQFQKYGDKYLLKGFWDDSDKSGFTTVVTHAEKVHAKSGKPVEHNVPATAKK